MNNPCAVGSKDTWTFERGAPTMTIGEGIKDRTAYDVESGCCGKLSPFLARDRLELIMELMKHSLGTPIPEDRLNKSFDELSVVRATEDITRKIEEK